MRTVNIILAVILVFFAALQYNDPDALYWVAVYLLAAFWCGLAVWKPALLARNMSVLVGAIASIVLFVVGFASLEPSIGSDWIHIEEARESLGYMICAASTLIAIFGARSIVRHSAGQGRPAAA